MTAHSTADSLLADRPLLETILMWLRKARIENMSLERMLASVRKSVGSRTPMAERVVTTGYLCQWMQQHKRAGGQDPRSTTRAQLAQRNVPLRASRKKLKREGAACVRPWMLYAAEQLRGRRMTRVELYARRRELARSFRELPPGERHRFQLAADARNLVSRLKRPDPAREQASQRYERLLGDSLWGLSSLHEPIRVDVAESQISAATGGRRDACGGGLTTALAPLRKSYIDTCFVQDAGSLGASFGTSDQGVGVRGESSWSEE